MLTNFRWTDVTLSPVKQTLLNPTFLIIPKELYCGLNLKSLKVELAIFSSGNPLDVER